MQVRKLSLTYFLARRRTNIKQLLSAENITSLAQLEQWCASNHLELTRDIDVHSLFPTKVTPIVKREPTHVVLEAPVKHIVEEQMEENKDVLHAVTSLTAEDEPTIEAPKKPKIPRKPKVEENEDNQ